MAEHWWCPRCGTFDGPHLEGACDVCAEDDAHTSVERLVARQQLEGAVEALREIVALDEGEDDGMHSPEYWCGIGTAVDVARAALDTALD